jgi:hypothetical protein
VAEALGLRLINKHCLRVLDNPVKGFKIFTRLGFLIVESFNKPPVGREVVLYRPHTAPNNKAKLPKAEKAAQKAPKKGP